MEHSIYSKMTLFQLQRELGLRNVRRTGRKAELCERLLALDKMQEVALNVEIPALPTPEGVSWPPAKAFRSMLLSDDSLLPDISKEKVREYVLYRQANDREANQDISAMEAGEKLAESHVLAMSMAWNEDGQMPMTEPPQMMFFSASVEASMKKLCYAVCLAVQQNGIVKSSSCDCPAGAGPTATCKHIVAGKNTLFYFQDFFDK